MKKCINQCENRDLDFISGANDFKYDSGASEKHFIRRLKIDHLLDIRDDAKT